MQITTIKAQDVRFDPVSGSFLALAEITQDGRLYRYACAFEGPISMPPTIAAHRLTQQAKKRHATNGALRSVIDVVEPRKPDCAPLPRVA